MKDLLITNDFPPTLGGVAKWYERICAAVPADRLIVLAPLVSGHTRSDPSRPYRIVRRRVPLAPHPVARALQIFVLFGHATRILAREPVRTVHIGHLYLGLIGLALKSLFGTPYVVYLHGGEMAPYLKFAVVRAVSRKIVRGASAVVTNSSFTIRHFLDLAISHPRTEVLTMSVATDRFHPGLDPQVIRHKYALDGQKVLLTVGRLVERKGHDMVLRALHTVRKTAGPVKYLIVGRGPEESRLRALARELKCAEDVIFIGHVPEEDLPLFYAACDIFVMPSRALPHRDGIEGFGIVFLEAGACGKPVVGGRSGGIADAVTDGVTGILVDPSDAQELASVLTELLLDDHRRTHLGTEAHRRAEALESTWRATLDRVWTAAAAEGNHRA